MTTNPLPDLSKWHEVPADADIPADTPYAWQDADGTWGASDGLAGSRYVASARATGTRYFTAEPIPAPRPAPPTEPGTVLLDVTADGRTWARMFNDGMPPYCWCAVGGPDGEVNTFSADDLVSWTVADVVPRTDPETIPEWERKLLAKGAPDPLDENDHRDRVEARGIRLTRGKCGRWHAIQLNCRATHNLSSLTLANWAEGYGPLRFADEVQS